MWVNNDNGMYTTKSLRQLYQSWIISPYMLKAAPCLAWWISRKFMLKSDWHSTWIPDLQRQTHPQPLPGQPRGDLSLWQSLWPGSNVSGSRQHVPTANLPHSVATIHHELHTVVLWYKLQAAFWAKLHVFEAWGQALNKVKDRLFIW